jgi:hypothetical protein
MAPREPTLAWRSVITLVPHFMIVQMMAQLVYPKKVVADLIVWLSVKLLSVGKHIFSAIIIKGA